MEAEWEPIYALVSISHRRREKPEFKVWRGI